MRLSTFRVWLSFSQILVNTCWLFVDLGLTIGENVPKNAQLGNCSPNARGFSSWDGLGFQKCCQSGPMGCASTPKNIRTIFNILLKISPHDFCSKKRFLTHFLPCKPIFSCKCCFWGQFYIKNRVLSWITQEKSFHMSNISKTWDDVFEYILVNKCCLLCWI